MSGERWNNLALLIVDPQNDFCLGGSLAVKEGDLVIPPLNRLSSTFRENNLPVFISRDWHRPDNTVHMGPGKWPLHCIQNTEGANFHPDLDTTGATIISKGMGNSDDGYSAFEGETDKGRGLFEVLQEAGIECLIIAGLATDYCVKETVDDALEFGFSVRVAQDAIRAVNVRVGDGAKALAEMTRAGAVMMDTDIIVRLIK